MVAADYGGVPSLHFDEPPVEFGHVVVDVAGNEVGNKYRDAAYVAIEALHFVLHDQVRRIPTEVKFILEVLRNVNILAALVGILWAAFTSTNKRLKIILGYLASLIASLSLLIGGLPMISTGLSMGCQESIIAYDLSGCVLGQVLKFALGPIAMAVASKIVGLHGNTLRAAIIQAAVPQAITSFIFCKRIRVAS